MLQGIRSLTFSKNGKLLVSGSDDYTVRLWDVQTGKMICDPLRGHTYSVSSVRFSPDMKQLLVGEFVARKNGLSLIVPLYRQ